LQQILQDGVSWKEVDDLISKGFVAYLWMVLEIWSNGKRKHPGPHNNDFQIIFKEKMGKTKEKWNSMKGQLVRYRTISLMNQMRLNKKKK